MSGPVTGVEPDAAGGGVDESAAETTEPYWFASAAQLNRRLGGLPLLGGNAAHLFSDYGRSIDAMTAAVEGATDFVHAEFYILNLDSTTQRFFDALADAVRRGVTVRVLFDHWASLRCRGYRRTKRFMTDAGVQLRGQERVASQLEEAIPHPDPLQREELCP